MAGPAGDDRLADLSFTIDRWLEAELATNPAVLAVERDVDGPHSWYVRLGGEARWSSASGRPSASGSRPGSALLPTVAPDSSNCV
jgi:hypothetical protein